MKEVVASRFHCWIANTTDTYTCTIEAGNAREAAIKAAPLLIENVYEQQEDSILIAVMNNKDRVENWRVSIQRKFTLNKD